MSLVGPELAQTKKRGRPRTFDADKLINDTVETFWKYGYAGTTTRVLETSLGISQSSLYNAYGSKDQLLDEAVARYETELKASVLAKLAVPSRTALLQFIDAVTDWVSNPEHPGCLVMNLACEQPGHAGRMEAYRIALTDGFSACLATFVETDQVSSRADVLTVAVLGLNLSARCGAPVEVLTQTADGIKAEINSW